MLNKNSELEEFVGLYLARWMEAIVICSDKETEGKTDKHTEPKKHSHRSNGSHKESHIECLITENV